MQRLRRSQARTSLRVEPLEDRTLLSVSLTGQTLFVKGTDADDIIRVSMRGGTQVVVKENGVEHVYSAAGIKNIVILGKGGSDRLIVDRSVVIPATIRGGDGDDLLRGGRGSDELYGGRGDDLLAGQDDSDWLYGQAGNDVLRGGRGQDVLRGGPGRDVLRGGRDWDDYRYDDHDDVPGHELEEYRRERSKYHVETEYKAYLRGPGGMTAKVEYEVKRGGVAKKKFEVEIYGAPAGRTYDIFVASRLVGTITIGPAGKGKLEYTTHPDSPGDQPFPANFPTGVGDGTEVRIGNVMQGKLKIWRS